jgi:hypothetical protein
MPSDDGPAPVERHLGVIPAHRLNDVHAALCGEATKTAEKIGWLHKRKIGHLCPNVKRDNGALVWATNGAVANRPATASPT